MTGRPDYDAGDLVVCVEAKIRVHLIGKVFRVLEIAYFPDKYRKWGVRIEGLPEPCGRWWGVEFFRRIDPKPPEFFAGKIETVREDELV